MVGGYATGFLQVQHDTEEKHLKSSRVLLKIKSNEARVIVVTITHTHTCNEDRIWRE